MSAERPTRVRHRVTALTLALIAVAYLDRVCIATAAPAIKTDLGLGDAEMGFVFSAFTFAYALFEVPSGWLADRYGARITLTRIVVWWSALTAATGLASGFGSLLAIRLLFGLGEAGTFPATARVYMHWLPYAERGRAFGLAIMTGAFGGALTQPLVVSLLDVMTWRHVFALFGCVGLVWAAAWWRWFRDEPRLHAGVNDAERQLIAASMRVATAASLHETAFDARVAAADAPRDGALDAPAASDTSPRGAFDEIAAPDTSPGGAFDELAAAAGARAHRVPWRQIVASRTLFALCAMYGGAIYGWYFYLTWLPTYLLRARGWDLREAGALSALPLLAIGVGVALGGWTSDVLTARWGARAGRRLPGVVGLPLAAAAVVAAALTPSPLAAALLLAAAAGLAALGVAPAWAVCLEIGGPHAGVVSGAMNTIGNLGGTLSPVVVGIALSRWGSWRLPLFSVAALYVVAGLCWLAIDPRERIAPSLSRAGPGGSTRS